MKMHRTILRKVELKIYHAITLEQMKKNPLTETQSKLGISKPASEESSGSK